MTHVQEFFKEGYLLEGETTQEDMFDRVARHLAVDRTEQYQRFSWVLNNMYFLPNSPTLMNAGTALNQLMACFVLPIEDSIDGIAKSLWDMMVIQKSGGGTGFVASRLRPEGDAVSTTGGTSSGPLSFLSIFNHAMGQVKQGGKRRGAALATTRVDHPDIFKFIKEKQNPKAMTNFNLSVGITNEFMRQVTEGGDFELINPRTGHTVQTVKAREIWDAIVECAWATGEPGILFLDTINAHNPTPHLGDLETTNPCGEVPLLPYEACCLGSINMAKMLRGNHIDWSLLKRVVCIGVEFLDRVIDVSDAPLPEIDNITKANRKIGLGVMGWGSMLFKLGIPYNSPTARSLAEEVQSFINGQATLQSLDLASQEGWFPNYPHSIHTTPRRHAAVTSIAPTGTISMIAGVTSGIEPAYALVYRRLIQGQEWRLVDPVFASALEGRGLYSDELLDRIEGNRGSIQGLRGVPEDMQEVFVTAHDISPGDHVDMQASFQAYTEQSISKTINLPNEASLQDVEQAFMRAYIKGCKGITVYRDGSRDMQVLSTKHLPSERPAVLEGQTRKFKTGCGSLYITCNRDPAGEPHEVFAAHAAKGGCVNALLNSLARVTSISLRSGVDPFVISNAMMGQTCGKCEDIASCAEAMGVTLGSVQPSCSLDGGCQTCG